MKKEILLFASIVLLGGCGAEDAQQADEGNSPTVIPDKKENKDETISQRIEAEKEAEEQEGKESVADPEPQLVQPQYKLKNDFSIESIANPQEKVVLLTIDDAPDKNALTMANTLKALNVKAIFFVNGHFIDSPEEGEILKQIHQMGFPIGNHT